MTPPEPRFISGSDLLDRLAGLPVPDPGFGEDVASLDEVITGPTDPWQP